MTCCPSLHMFVFTSCMCLCSPVAHPATASCGAASARDLHRDSAGRLSRAQAHRCVAHPTLCAQDDQSNCCRAWHGKGEKIENKFLIHIHPYTIICYSCSSMFKDVFSLFHHSSFARFAPSFSRWTLRHTISLRPPQHRHHHRTRWPLPR